MPLSKKYMDLKTLVKRAQTKDSHALETLYNMYYPKMLGLCIKITKEDEETAKDLVHDAFILAFSSLRNLNTPERFGKWLTSIVRNVALKYMERKNRICFGPIINEEEKLVDTNVSADSIVNIQDILDLVNELPNGYGTILRLYAIEGFSHKEIAEILGIEPHSSSSQLSRAKAMLQKIAKGRLLAIVLLITMAIPLYYFILRKKTLQPQRSPIIVKDDKKRKDITNKENISIVKEKTYAQVAAHKNIIPSNTNKKEEKDTTLLLDTTMVETPISDMEIVEYKQDSTKYVDSIKPQFILSDNELALNDTKKKSAEWHILTTGSVGPTLAQNIYQLITTDKFITDIEGPMFPENIDTWEDYSRYLHMTTHNQTPQDTLVLMEIADHNQGKIIEKEQHDRPITFGISLSKPITQRWSFKTGLQYSLLRSNSTMGNESYYIGKQQKIHYLGIPLGISYRIADYKNLSTYSSVAVSIQIPIYGKVNCNYIVNNMSAYTHSWSIAPSVQWTTDFSIGIQYNFLSKWALYVEPTLYWHIPNGSSIHTIWTEHPIMFSVPFGIRFTW